MLNSEKLERIDDKTDAALMDCGCAWVVKNKCVWCGASVAPKPVERIKYDPSWDMNDDFDDERGCCCGVIGCPECDEDYYENFDCGMMSDGLCTKAGSEDCDWDCPYSNSEDAE